MVSGLSIVGKRLVKKEAKEPGCRIKIGGSWSAFAPRHLFITLFGFPLTAQAFSTSAPYKYGFSRQ
jgi:hypothetical protein